MASDPICGMDVDPQTAEYQTEYKGKTYYFCSFDCKRQFDLQPEAYTDPNYRAPGMRQA